VSSSSADHIGRSAAGDAVGDHLAAVGHQYRKPRPARRTKSVRLGRPAVGDISNVHDVLSLVEGDARK
jgi:hypothetical protein